MLSLAQGHSTLYHLYSTEPSKCELFQAYQMTSASLFRSVTAIHNLCYEISKLQIKGSPHTTGANVVTDCEAEYIYF